MPTNDSESPESQPQLKDPELYEKLRDEGNSKAKSARISNAAAKRGRSEVGHAGGTSPAYEEWTVDELKSRAKELDLHNYSDLTKADLIDLLREH